MKIKWILRHMLSTILSPPLIRGQLSAGIAPAERELRDNSRGPYTGRIRWAHKTRRNSITANIPLLGAE